MTLLGTGNVGIGMTTPGARLGVAVADQDNATNPLAIAKGASTYLTVLNNGNVGIGTTNPSAKLEVNGTVKATSFSGNGANLNNLDASKITTGTLKTECIPIISGDRITFGTLANNLLYLRADKKVDIGGQRPNQGGALLYVMGTSAFMGSSSITGDLSVNEGKIFGTVVQPSDARIKTNLLSVDPFHSLQRLLDLTLYEYEYLPAYQPATAGQKYHGFLAQEVEQVIPEAVSMTGDHQLSDGRVIEGLRAVTHDRIFSEAVGAIQALYAMVQTQAARLRVLEAQVAGGQPA